MHNAEQPILRHRLTTLGVGGDCRHRPTPQPGTTLEQATDTANARGEFMGSMIVYALEVSATHSEPALCFSGCLLNRLFRALRLGLASRRQDFVIGLALVAGQVAASFVIVSVVVR